MRVILLSLFFCVTAVKLSAQSTINIGTTSVSVDTVASGMDIPWEIIWGSDNHLWVTERKGIVSRINPQTKQKTILLNLSSSVYQQSEAGMLGMILHPNFSTTPEVFLAYTYITASVVRERIVKYTFNGTTLVNPDTLLENIPGNTTHIGARFLFLPDTTLLVTTGDAQNTSLPQNLNSLAGKVLRMKTDGSIPADNPFPNSYVYALGFRNAQGLMRHPNGTIYLSEHGPSNDDEFQILLPGRNYGWPNVEGFCDSPSEQSFCNANNVKEPLLTWSPTIAPSDMVYYTNPAFPEFHNTILMTVLKDKKVIAFRMNNNGDSVLSQTHYLTNAFQRLRDICVGNNSELYLATNGASWTNNNPNTHTIIRLTPPVFPTKIDEKSSGHFRIFPNPITDKVTIETDGELPVRVKIFDGLGRILFEKMMDTPSQTFEVSEWTGGVYYMLISDTKGRWRGSYKLIK